MESSEVFCLTQSSLPGSQLCQRALHSETNGVGPIARRPLPLMYNLRCWGTYIPRHASFYMAHEGPKADNQIDRKLGVINRNSFFFFWGGGGGEPFHKSMDTLIYNRTKYQ